MGESLIEINQCTLSSWANNEDNKNQFVRFHDFGTYNFAIQLVSDLVHSKSYGAVRIVADPGTVVDVRTKSESLFPGVVITDLSKEYPDSRFVGLLRQLDQVFIILSKNFSAAIVWMGGKEDSETVVEDIGGIWTTDVASVQRLLNLMTDKDTPIDVPAGTDTSIAIALMNGITQHYEEQQRDALTTQSDLSVILEILKSLSVRRRTHDILYLFVEQIAHYINTDRCSVVRIWDGDSKAHVLASHEDETVEDMIIQLEKYPEIAQTLDTSAQTVINDVKTNSLTRDFAPALEKAGITAIMVMPIVLFNQNVGSFLLRAVRKGGSFVQREVEFCQIVAESAANAIERADLFETIQKANRRLEYLAVTDSLTGLYNRRYFRTRLEDEYSRSKRYGSPLSCMLIDIDNFKEVNDTYGHLVGDDVLCEISNRTLKAIRTNDVVARYGGEELVVILPQTDSVGAKKYGQRLLDAIGGEPFSGLPEDRPVTVSIGVAVFNSERHPTPDDLVHAADKALYEAKDQGKNRMIMGE